jgi:hypothetical protein
MSSFKELKKREKIKAWESKIRRLYACEHLSDDDLKYLNIQYDLYKLRKTNTYLWGIAGFGIPYFFPFMDGIFWAKRVVFAFLVSVIVFGKMRTRNRYHYETIIMPYFEKYYIK